MANLRFSTLRLLFSPPVLDESQGPRHRAHVLTPDFSIRSAATPDLLRKVAGAALGRSPTLVHTWPLRAPAPRGLPSAAWRCPQLNQPRPGTSAFSDRSTLRTNTNDTMQGHEVSPNR